MKITKLRFWIVTQVADLQAPVVAGICLIEPWATLANLNPHFTITTRKIVGTSSFNLNSIPFPQSNDFFNPLSPKGFEKC